MVLLEKINHQPLRVGVNLSIHHRTSVMACQITQRRHVQLPAWKRIISQHSPKEYDN
jgi:hypothetical protein